MSEPSVPPPPSYTPPPPPPGGIPPGPGIASPNRTLMIVLSYAWILALVPFLVEKDDPEVQWHAKNGLILTGAELIIYLALWFLGVATSWIDMGCLAGITGCVIQPIIFVAILVFRIIAIIKGTSGQRLVIPVLSDYISRF